MKTEEFEKCRQFLESSIKASPENGELLKVYLRLIELKSEYDKETDKAWIEKEIRDAELNAHYQTAVHANNTDLGKTYQTNTTNQNIAWNQQQSENYRHNQAQVYGTIQSAFQYGALQNTIGR